jgi:hypothetical protein
MAADDTAEAAPQAPAGEFDDLIPAQHDPGTLAALADAQQSASNATARARGAVKGITGVLTVPADAAIWATNKVRKAIDPNATTLDTDAGDLVNKGLDAVGLKAQPGVSGTLNELAGGLSAGARAPGSAVAAADNAPSQFWKLSGTQGGRNQQVAASAIGDSIGEPGITKVTAEVLDNADKRISAALDTARSSTKITAADPKAAAQAIIDANSKWTETSGSLMKSDTVQNFLKDLNRGFINNEELGDYASKLGKAAKSAMRNGDHDLGSALFDVKNYAEGLISNNLTGPEKQAYDAARGQYRNLWSVLLARSGHIGPDGTTDMAAVGRHLFRMDPEGFMLGRNTSPLYEVARQAVGGPLNLMQDVAQGAIGPLKKVGQLGPQALQYLMQQGGPRFVQWASRQPGVAAALKESGDDNAVD